MAGTTKKKSPPRTPRSTASAAEAQPGTDHDKLKVSRVLLAAAYRSGGDVTSLKPAMNAFGTGVPVEIVTRTSIDAQGRSSVRNECTVDGRSFVVEA